MCLVESVSLGWRLEANLFDTLIKSGVVWNLFYGRSWTDAEDEFPTRPWKTVWVNCIIHTTNPHLHIRISIVLSSIRAVDTTNYVFLAE